MRITESNDISDIVLLRCAFAPSPFGEVLTAADEYGLCFAGFVGAGGREAAEEDMSRRFPQARTVYDSAAAVDIFGDIDALHIAGSEFRRRVWRTLMTVGPGQSVSYSQLAHMAGMPRAVRAVASAVACNPLSIVVPCHRVVRSDGSAGEYHWGAELKRRLLEYEQDKNRYLF